MFTNVMLFTTTLIAELVRALISSTILMINSFFKKVIVWMCLFPTSVGGIPSDPTSSVLIVAALIVSVLVLFFARKSLQAGCHRRRPKEEEPAVVLVAAKKRLIMPPLSITCRNRPDCHCLCRPKKFFEIPDVPDGYKRVLVPTPGAKCGACEYIIVRELQQSPVPRPFDEPLPTPTPPPKPVKRVTTLDAIPEVPNGYTRVLAPVPGTNCGERDFIIVVCKGGELLDQDGDSVMTTSTAISSIKNPSTPPKKKISRRIGIREKILPFELHDQIIQYSHDHMNWTKALMRDYPPEFFLYARKITRKSNFLHGAMGDCALRLGCGIKTIEEEDGSVVDHVELLDEEESIRPTDGNGVDEGHQEEEEDSFGSDITFVEEDNVQEDVVIFADDVIPVATGTVTTNVSTPGHTEEDGTHVFAADSSCHHDSLLDDGNHDDVSQLQEQEGSGYYIDDKGRKRRFSLRIMAKKSASTKKDD